MKKRKNTISPAWFAMGAVAAFILAAGFCFVFMMREPSGDGTQVVIQIKKGDSIQQIAEKLDENDLIPSKLGFIFYAKTSKYQDTTKYGKYTLKKGMTREEILKALSKEGDTGNTVTFTIPEGYSVEMTADLVASKNLCTREAFLNAVKNTGAYKNSWIATLPKTQGITYALEGFLYPDTYNVYKKASPEAIVQKMLNNFDEHYQQIVQSVQYKGNRNMYQLITIASIIEREASVESERPKIAGVIENRLAKKMKLQMCPTVLYVITGGKYNVNRVLYKDLKVKSPYNTYIHYDLPPGPICNPGKLSIQAAMTPEKHDFLFYHTDGSGNDTHIFTKTYEEHEDSRIQK